MSVIINMHINQFGYSVPIIIYNATTNEKVDIETQANVNNLEQIISILQKDYEISLINIITDCAPYAEFYGELIYRSIPKAIVKIWTGENENYEQIFNNSNRNIQG